MLAKAEDHVENYSPVYSPPAPRPPLTPIACRWGQVPEARLEYLLLTVHPQVHSSAAFSTFVKLGRAMSQPLTREREGGEPDCQVMPVILQEKICSTHRGPHGSTCGARG